jgi:signal peptidase II
MAKQKSFKSFSSSPSTSLTPWLGIATIIILIDQITKVTITRLFTYGESRPVTSFFNLVLAYNKGAAFSFLAGESGWQRYIFTGIAIAAAIFILVLLKRHAGQRLFCWALALILGGALGNLIDRVLYGHVIDFLDFYLPHSHLPHWPAFNVADMAIVGGAGLFILDELRRVGK